MNPDVNWIIHLVANGACDCGDVETDFLPYACNAHTHGMSNYNHQDFQLVLRLPNEEIMHILNTMGIRVQNGECFKAGDFVSGIYEDCRIRLDEFEEVDRTVLRVVIPDKYGVFPNESNCMDVYRLQNLTTDNLSINKNNFS